MAEQPLRIGAVDFLNCVPYFHALAEKTDDWELIRGAPAGLNRMLAAGELDLSISSAFEYLLHHEQYYIHPHLGIASDGPIQSILLLSRSPLADLGGKTIAVTTQSASARAQIEVLMRAYYRLAVTIVDLPDVSDGEGRDAILLIGDEALRAGAQHAWEHAYDVGQLWKESVGAPFVYALWIARKHVVETQQDQLQRFFEALIKSMDDFSSQSAEIAPKYAEIIENTPEMVQKYWENVQLRLEKAHFEGLSLFMEGCVGCGLVPSPATFCFLPGFR